MTPLPAAQAALPWPALLDAMEERTRQLAQIVEDAEVEVEVEVNDVPLSAQGPLPRELEVRARALLEETLRLADRAERRKVAVDRELRYRRS